ncbi:MULTISPECIES: DUF2931 family protein [unclassified Pseudomonas]|uniref:DUF2931 family protein n=1 Tax=unclassified Pseudomonas TaxID=196821 RepID=UPI002114EB48|nr:MULTISPECIES: DUF2931 family protein [unclassified Pseudomonas]
MNKLNALLGCALAVILCGCSHVNDYGTELPYDAWRLGFLAPNYMEVWIETANVLDVKGRIFGRAMSGVAAIQIPPNLRGNPRGWPKRPGDGKGKHLWRADVPRMIYVRWQSLAEPQTYDAFIEIPEATRDAMLEVKPNTYCRGTKEWITDHRQLLVIGLAPGGIAKTWIRGLCLDPIEVSRVQGRIVEKGPDLGRTNGRYALELEPESRAYIEKFGIPYGSW